jgi:hypothetical protein
VVDVRHQDPYFTVSEPEFMDYRRDVRSLAALAAYAAVDATLATAEAPERVQVARVSDGFFGVLGVAPALGRTFTREEEAPGGPPVVVISEGLWRRHFGADPRIVGKTALLNDQPRTIVGVMPARSTPARDVAVWSPLRLRPDSLWTAQQHYLTLVGRLARAPPRCGRARR